MTQARFDLLCELEKMVGESCYNEFIQNYENWEYVNDGRHFRYPLSYLKDFSIEKTRVPKARLDASNVLSGHYKFGANELAIMGALAKILYHLEKKYGFSVDAGSKPMDPIQEVLEKPKFRPHPSEVTIQRIGRNRRVKAKGSDWMTIAKFKEVYGFNPLTGVPIEAD